MTAPGPADLPIELDAWLRQLAGGRPAERIAALAGLSAADGNELNHPRIQDALIVALGDPEKAVRRVAVELIERAARRSPGWRERLGSALESPDSERRWAAAFALGRLGAPTAASLPVLLEHLGHADGDVRWAAHKLLVRLSSEEARVRDAALRLASQAASRTKKMALYLLRDLRRRDAELERLLLAALADSDRDVRLAAINVLIKLDIALPEARAELRRLEQDDPFAGVRRAAKTALLRLT
ncbi:MAG TPA: HEAT repeat domain-containing protein [Acidobacteriota bacterium]